MWKEIAAYLKRDVTTVRRWEKREALPVRRHLHARRDSVYAFRSEIDAWWQGRSGQLTDNGVNGTFRQRSLMPRVTGGSPRAIADAPRPRGGTWNRAGVILFARKRFLYLADSAAPEHHALLIGALDHATSEPLIRGGDVQCGMRQRALILCPPT